MIVMADPVSISAFCGVLLQFTSIKTGLVVVDLDGFQSPQGSVPSFDPFIRKNVVVVDNHGFDALFVHTCNSQFPSCKNNCWLNDFVVGR